MTRAGRAKALAQGLLALLVSACGSLPPPPPPVDLPVMSAAAPPGIETWWAVFGDLRLESLIGEALGANLDLRIAMARIDEARAAARLANAALFPSLDVGLGVSRSRVSAANARQLPPPLATTTHNLGFQAAYELDLWGRISAGQSAAESSLLATRYAAQTLRLTLAAEVASNYFSLIALDDELRITRATLATREENVRLLQRRRDAGLASDYEFALADAERASVATVIPVLEQARGQLEAALASLTGRSAREVFAPKLERAAKSDAIAEVPAGLPSDLLARRPDIRRAEAELAAADAGVAEARASFFPRLSLTGSYGGESAAFSDLLTSPARVWSIAGALLQPLIGLASIDARLDAAKARREQSIAAYQKTVQAAFRDIHDALLAQVTARHALAAQGERRRSLAQAMKLAESRHVSGYSSYVEVLDAQRNLLDAERGEVTALRDRRLALIGVYRALGGGWDAVEPVLSIAR